MHELVNSGPPNPKFIRGSLRSDLGRSHLRKNGSLATVWVSVCSCQKPGIPVPVVFCRDGNSRLVESVLECGATAEKRVEVHMRRCSRVRLGGGRLVT